MIEQDFLYFKKFFKTYVKKFYSSDSFVQENIVLKEEHTYRVLKAVNIIFDSMKFNGVDKMIVGTTALFHDIGRFYQFEKYKTFDDKISENHGKLSVEILKNEKVLDILSEYEKNLILDVIMYHNSYKLPEDKGDDFLTYSRILRDGDKFDIFKVLTDYYGNIENEIKPVLEHDLSDEKNYSFEIIEDILNKKNSDKSLLKTRYDMRLFVLTWIFDINYSATIKMIEEEGYIDKILRVLPSNKDIDEVGKTLKDYMKSRR